MPGRTTHTRKPIDVYKRQLADGAGSALGTGGMSTKLRAAQRVTAEGADMVIANGSDPELLYDCLLYTSRCI